MNKEVWEQIEKREKLQDKYEELFLKYEKVLRENYELKEKLDYINRSMECL